MDPITVHTGLERFLMPDAIRESGPSHIKARMTVSESFKQPFRGIEALAQTGALHVRYVHDFKKHAFLLGITDYEGPAVLSPGIWTLSGTSDSRSKDAFAYTLSGEYHQAVLIRGHFLFAVVDYNNDFQRKQLEDHYRNLFTCLTKNT